MKTSTALLLLAHLALAGFSAAALAGVFGERKPAAVGIHVACLVFHLFSGAAMTAFLVANREGAAR